MQDAPAGAVKHSSKDAGRVLVATATELRNLYKTTYAMLRDLPTSLLSDCWGG